MDSSGLPSLTNYRNVGNSSQISGFGLIWKVEEMVFQEFRAGSSLILKFPAGVGHPHCRSRKELWVQDRVCPVSLRLGFLGKVWNDNEGKASGKMEARSRSLSLRPPHSAARLVPGACGVCMLCSARPDPGPCPNHLD